MRTNNAHHHPQQPTFVYFYPKSKVPIRYNIRCNMSTTTTRAVTQPFITSGMPPCVEAAWEIDEVCAALTNKAAEDPVRAFPTALDLISSNDPARYVRMIDLTNNLGPEVAAFNAANPNAPISLCGKAEFMNPGMSHKVWSSRFRLPSSSLATGARNAHPLCLRDSHLQFARITRMYNTSDSLAGPNRKSYAEESRGTGRVGQRGRREEDHISSQ